MPINSFIQHIQKNKRYSEHTVKAYENDLTQLQEYLSVTYESDLKEADSRMLRSWIVSLLEKGVQTKSVNRKISTLKSFYNFLLREKSINSSPTAKLISPKTEKPLPTFVKKTEMENLLEGFSFEDSFSGKRDELIIELLYSCGIRLSELISLKEQSVSKYEGTMKV